MKLASIALVLLFTLFGLTNKASAAKLTLYCSVEIDVCEMLEQAYEKETGTKVAMTRASSGETFAKIKAESSNPKGDVWFGGTGDPHLTAAQENLTAEYKSSHFNDLLPAAQYIANVKMKPDETKDVVEFAVKLEDVLCPIDSHWPIEKYKAIDEAYQAKNKDALALARSDLAAAFRAKAKKVAEKYIMPPKTTDFAIVYAPTEGLYAELSSYRDPKNKELLMEELRTKYKVTVAGPNTLCAILQAFHMGFHTLKVQKHSTQIHDDLKNITTRFVKHFDGILILRKKLEETMKVTDDFGRDARSIMRTLENIRDPEQVEKAIKEDVDKIKILNK